MPLRNAKELTAERLAERNDREQKRHDEALARAEKEIETAHKARKNTAHVFDVPESVDAVLREHGYRVKMVPIDPETAGPGTCRSVTVDWD